MSQPVGSRVVLALRWLAAAVAAVTLLAACTRDDNSQEPDPVRDDEGQVLDDTEVAALRVQVGDCFNGTIPFAVESIDAVPCEQPHDHQAYAVFDIDPSPDPAATSTTSTTSEDGTSTTTATTVAAADEEYPGEARVQELGERGCLVAFGEYVGNAYETSALDIGLILPTEESWDAIDDREVVCTVHRADGTQLTASAEGSGL